MKSTRITVQNVIGIIVGVGAFFLLTMPYRHYLDVPDDFSPQNEIRIQIFFLVLSCAPSFGLTFFFIETSAPHNYVIVATTVGICAVVIYGFTNYFPLGFGIIFECVCHIFIVLACAIVTFMKNEARFKELQKGLNEDKDK